MDDYRRILSKYIESGNLLRKEKLSLKYDVKRPWMDDGTLSIIKGETTIFTVREKFEYDGEITSENEDAVKKLNRHEMIVRLNRRMLQKMLSIGLADIEKNYKEYLQ